MIDEVNPVALTGSEPGKEVVPDNNGTAAASAAGDSTAAAYNQDSVQILRDAAHIRQRPGMYIGDTSTKGLHHLVYELVHNSVDEALAGYCRTIHVVIGLDGSASVVDDGRGIPVEEHPEAKRPTLEVVLTTMGSGTSSTRNPTRCRPACTGSGPRR